MTILSICYSCSYNLLYFNLTPGSIAVHVGQVTVEIKAWTGGARTKKSGTKYGLFPWVESLQPGTCLSAPIKNRRVPGD